jgi:3-phenylpropionate/trans-cinnamate dioxygenase ferredoxin component
MPLVRVAQTNDIPPDQTRYYCVAGRPVVIAHRAGRFYALGGICPHKGHPLAGAALWDDLIDCPWHHFQYDIRTGENHFPKNVYPADVPGLEQQLRPLPVYPLVVRESEIWVQLE